ncbi:DUF2794 domain-containing protein [Novosphingobium resinovorum]
MARLRDGFRARGRQFQRFSPRRRTPAGADREAPSLRGKQGMWTLFGEAGQVLKRGHELSNVLSSLERKLLKVVED